MRLWYVCIMVFALLAANASAICSPNDNLDQSSNACLASGQDPNNHPDVVNQMIQEGQNDVPWDQIDPSIISDTNVPEVPPDRIRLEEFDESQLEHLTKEQVLENKADLEKINVDKLSQEVKDAIGADMTGTESEQATMETSPETEIRDRGDHTEITHLPSLVTPTVQLTDARDIKVYENGCWEVKEASIIDFFGVSNAQVFNSGICFF